MADPEVTVVVVPRERFSFAARSLENIYAQTNSPFSLIYVDGGSPTYVKRYLEKEAQRRGFQLIRTDHYLSPNQARNIGLRQVKTPYVVFVDNDTLFTPGWLEALVRCAEETGAWVCGPLYFIGEFESQIIHMAGGKTHIINNQGKRFLYEEHKLMDSPMAGLSSPLQREQCEFVEFHCMLVRTEVFEKIGLLDEGLLSTHEHIDFCLNVREAGGSIYFEPQSAMTYIPPPVMAWSDLRYFMLRWSDKWQMASLRHFQRKWNLDEADPMIADHIEFGRYRRRQVLFPQKLQDLYHRVFGKGSSSNLRHFILSIESTLNQHLVRDPRKKP